MKAPCHPGALACTSAKVCCEKICTQKWAKPWLKGAKSVLKVAQIHRAAAPDVPVAPTRRLPAVAGPLVHRDDLLAFQDVAAVAVQDHREPVAAVVLADALREVDVAVPGIEGLGGPSTNLKGHGAWASTSTGTLELQSTSKRQIVTTARACR